MPLQIQVIDGMVGNNPVFLSSPAGIPYQYESGAQASAIVAENQRLHADSIPPKRFRIVKMEDSPAESDLANKEWRSRELGRFESGFYQRVPWADESWFKDSKYAPLHHCHMSRDKSAMVAFTESDEKGRDDKQKRMRAGRYLTKYFGESGAIDDSMIRHWAGKLSILVGESDLVQFATTPDDIEEIYTSGPHSCMAHHADHYQGPIQPTRIYGAGDLAVAYIERASSIAARVLCYPANKVYSTVYGDGGVWSNQLKALLDSAGYRFSSDSGDWNGARLLRVEADCGFVVPYFDIPGNATDDGEYLRVSYHGEIECCTEHGVSEDSGRRCDNCGDIYDDENCGGTISDSSYCDLCYHELSFHCEDCNETGFAEDSCYINGLEKHVCDSCAADYPSCDSCGNQHHADSMIDVAALDKIFCESCFSNECATCGECGDPDSHSSMVERIDGESICSSCAESMIECAECDKYDESKNCFEDSDGAEYCGDCRQESLDLESDKESV